MADMRIFEVVAAQAFHNLEIHIAVYGPWINVHFVQ
jgi:hypothetical protein